MRLPYRGYKEGLYALGDEGWKRATKSGEKKNEVTVYGMQALRDTREDDMLGIALRRMSGSS
jgi:hypothetical protein